MKIEYKIGDKNYIIEDDRSCYILREFGVIAKGARAGEVAELDAVYLSTLEKAFEILLKKSIKYKSNTLELNEALKVIKEINTEFLKEIKEIVKEIK